MTMIFMMMLTWFGFGPQQFQVYSSGGDQTLRMEIVQEDGVSELHLNLDGETLTLDPDMLLDGESQEYTLSDGGVVTLRRDGETVTIEHGDSVLKTFLHGGDLDDEHAFIIHSRDHDESIVFEAKEPGVTILGAGDLEEEVRQKIETILREAGVDRDITFSDFGFHTSGEGHVWISDRGVKLKRGGQSRVLVIDKKNQ